MSKHPMPRIINVVKVYADGACSGNPGPGAIGVIVLNENNQELTSCGECVGGTTNNKAEYRALIRGLELASGLCRRKVVCYSDNELVVKQINGLYRTKNAELRKLCIEVKNTAQLFDKVVYQYTPRTNSYISKADKLAKQALAGT